jgi:hypothetical protein
MDIFPSNYKMCSLLHPGQIIYTDGYASRMNNMQRLQADKLLVMACPKNNVEDGNMRKAIW